MISRSRVGVGNERRDEFRLFGLHSAITCRYCLGPERRMCRNARLAPARPPPIRVPTYVVGYDTHKGARIDRHPSSPARRERGCGEEASGLQPTRVIASTSSIDSLRPTDTRFSSRWATVAVPGMGSMADDRASNQASTTCRGVAP